MTSDTMPIAVENYATKLSWVDGKPVVVGVPLQTGSVTSRMKDLLTEAMNLPYDGGDKRYVGLTKGEAIIIDLVDQASLGDSTARKEVLDRAFGKPVQNVKSLTVRGTIEDFLDELPEYKPATEVSRETAEDAEFINQSDESEDL